MGYELPINTGALQNPYQQFTLTVAPGAVETVFFNFNYIRFITLATLDASNLQVRIADNGQPTTVIGAGIGIELPVVVPRVSFKNTGGTSITFTFALAVGIIHDDRVNFAGGGIPVVFSSPDNFTSAADLSIAATSQSSIAANSNRYELILSNPSTNAAAFRVGDSGASATEGAILAPGATMVLTTKAQVYIFNTGATTQSIANAQTVY